MYKEVALFFMLVILIPIANAISIKELIARYSFSASSPEVNIINYTDFMIDKNNNGINDTLIIEVTTNSISGQFVFVINLFDQYIITNQTNETLSEGTNKLNLTFNSNLLTQREFNYSIKVYNSTNNLKYRKDKIPTAIYPRYEQGFEISGTNDYRDENSLIVNITLNSSINGTFETTLFLHYNNSVAFIKENKSVADSLQDLIYRFDNETIKKTHYEGSFNISLRIGNKIFKSGPTQFYDFKEFAASPYIFNFDDEGIDTDGDNKYNLLKITADAEIFRDNYYSIVLSLYDLFGSIIEIRNESLFLNAGHDILSFNFNGSRMHNKKLNGPFVIKHLKLYENNTLIDGINEAYVTKNYNFDDFDNPNLPDLKPFISVSDEFHYGINNITINVSFRNIGNKHAFNVQTEFFDNNSLSKSNNANILHINSKIFSQINMTNFSDFEVTAIADLANFVEESDETNNGERLAIKLNHKPELDGQADIIVNATGRIIINLSAFDIDEDNLSFFVNLSRFSKNKDLFEWNTTLNDSGEYTLTATASDGFLNDSEIFRITILNITQDAIDNDLDNDGVPDDVDRLIGDKNFVNTSTLNLTISVNGSTNLSKLFNQSLKVKFLDNDFNILEFDFDFSNYILNLTNLTINKQMPKQKGSLLVKGLRMPNGATKTAYVDRINKKKNDVCVKDLEISSINKISKKCNKKNEFKVKCSSKKSSKPKMPYRCAYNSTTNKFKVEGLIHSGIVQV